MRPGDSIAAATVRAVLSASVCANSNNNSKDRYSNCGDLMRSAYRKDPDAVRFSMIKTHSTHDALDITVIVISISPLVISWLRKRPLPSIVLTDKKGK
jgi:hypothetical protein